MKRLNDKRLAAICLSICLAASQSMISVPVYAGQVAGGEIRAEGEGGGAAAIASGLDETDGAETAASGPDKTGDAAKAASKLDKADGGAEVTSSPNEADGAETAASGPDETQAETASPSDADHGETRDEDAAGDSESQGNMPDDPEADGDLLLNETTAAQVTDWQWIDPAHHLTDGILALPDVNPDNQAGFDAVVSRLPVKILATVAGTATASDADTATASNAKAGRQKELVLDGWSCDTFQTDRAGNWPTVGEYTFEAHLLYGGGYILSDNAEPLEVKVVLGGGNLLQNQSGTDDFTVSGGVKDTDYSYENHTLTVLTDTPLEISGSTVADKIAVANSVKADITLAGVNIATSDYNSPLNMDGADESKITLKAGTVNTLDGSATTNSGPGIYVPGGKRLTITGTGSLIAKGGRDWPGIGRDNDGNILIESGNIEAKSGSRAAGIGGSSWCSGGDITITGGTVTATGGTEGSDIGGGYFGDGGATTISGGTVTTTGYYGIGYGRHGGDSTFSTGTAGHGVIITDRISDKHEQADWSGVIFENAKGQVYGNPVITADFNIPENKKLSIGSNHILTVNGTMTNHGILTVFGTLTGNGTLDNQGTATHPSNAVFNLHHTGNEVIISDTGDFTVKNGVNGTDYSYGDGTLTILTGTPLEISSSITEEQITVAASVKADITLAGVNIATSDNNCPLSLKSAGESKIILKEGTVNTLDGSAAADFGPGIYAPEEKQLTVTGTGTLIAKGGRDWPGIGRGDKGNILIENGKIEAVGGLNAAGIGGSSGCNGGSITITGGEVTAAGNGGNSADIGSGDGSSGSAITINGGTVTTAGSQGIGNKDTFSTGTAGHAVIVTKRLSDKSEQANWSGVIFEDAKGQVYGNPIITADFDIPKNKKLMIGSKNTLTVNGTVTNKGDLAVYGTLAGSGVLDNQGTAIQSSDAVISLTCKGTPVEMNGAVDFTVKGGKNGTDYSYDGETLTILTNTPLEISGTTTAAKIAVAADMQADITLAGVNIATSDHNCPLSLESAGKSKLTLKEGTVNTLDGSAATGSGPGIYVPNGEQLTITGTGTLIAKGSRDWPGIGRNNGGNVLIENGKIEAEGGLNAAGIGGSSECNGGNITITGGTVTAAGGRSRDGIMGSDIGNGYYGEGSIITISGGTVTTTGDHGIGDGESGRGSTFSTGSPGNAVIVTKKISDKSGQASWSGVIFEGTKGQVYGNPIMTADFDIPESKKLVISSKNTLTVNSTMTNNGDLAVYGTLTGSGILNNLGTAIRLPDAVISLTCEGTPVEMNGTIDFTVKGGKNGTDYSYDGETLTVLTNTPLEISGTTTASKIAVAANVAADITLAGVSITTGDHNSPLNMDRAFESRITLKEGTVNTLDGSHASDFGPGIYVPDGKQLTITGTGKLVAKGGTSWPGIGRNGGGNILIENGNIEAVSGSGSAGIGGSYGRAGGSITITGGVVSVTGGTLGIGGGSEDNSSTFSTGENGSAFIVASSISDKSNQASWSGVIFEGVYGAVYGSPTLATDIEIPAGKTLIIDKGNTLTLGSGICLTNKGLIFMSGNSTLNGQGNIVNDSTIYKSDQATLSSEHLTGGGTVVKPLDNISYDTGDGSQGKQDGVFPIHSDLTVWPSGWYITDQSISISDRSLVAGDVHLILADGETLTAQRGINVAEGNSLTVYGQEKGTGALMATGDGNGSGIGASSERNAGNITIKGGTVNARGSMGAGIGGGEKGMGGTVVISGGSVTAQGGGGAAGIGAGYGAQNTYGSVTISGGRVTATGGYVYDGQGGGAGIGGGGCGHEHRDRNGSIIISGGYVTAYGASDGGRGKGAGIGAGHNGEDASFSTGDHGNAVIFASDISGYPQGDHPDWGGVIFQGNEGVVYGTPMTPLENIEISDRQTLTIGSGKTLIIDSGRTLVNKGTIRNNGTLIIKGTLLDYGPITENAPQNSGGTIKQSPKVTVSFTEADAPITEAVYGKTVTLTAAVTPIFGNVGTGTVDFYLGSADEGLKLGGDVAVQDKKAALEVELTGEKWKPAAYTITAAYHAAPSSDLMDSNGSGDLRVKKISQVTPKAPTASETTDTIITLNTVSGQRYCLTHWNWDLPDINSEEWKTASDSTLAFSDLHQDNKYYFWTYIPGNEYTENSPISTSAEITTSKSDDQKAVEAAAAIIENASYRVDQAETDTEEAIESQLVKQMNALPGMMELNIPIIPDHIRIGRGDSAVAGDAENPSGQDGYFMFSVSLQKGEGNTKGDTYTNALRAVITATPYIDPQVSAVKSAIENGTYTVKQEEANTKAAVKTWLAGQINALPAIDGSGIEVKAGDISVDHFTAAVSGDINDRAGKNGSFAFSAALSKGAVHDTAAGMGGIITAARYKAPPLITTESLPEGKEGSPYTAVLEATGDPTIRWSIISGSLPEGLTLSGAVISGNPNRAGSFSFTIQAENGNAPAAAKEFTITVSEKGTDGGGSGGSDSDSDSSSAAAPRQPQPPATGESSVKGQIDQAGSGAVNIPDGNITSAIQKAKGQSGKGGISLTVNVALDRTPQTLTVTLSKAALDAMIAANVEKLKIGNPLLDYSLNLDALKELRKSVADSLAITAKRLDGQSLSQAAQAMIGSRPVFDLTVTSGGRAISGLGNGSACLWIPYTLGENETAAYVEAVCADGNEGAQWLPDSNYDTAAKTLKLTTRHLSVYGVGYRTDAPQFADIAGSWAKEDIEFAAARGLLAGTGEAAFSPDSAITKEEFAAALGQLSGAGLPQYLGGTGIPLSPNGPISREQMAVLMMNFINSIGTPLPKARESITFVDSAHISGWAGEAVRAMQMAGVMGAKDGNCFNPQDTVTRAETTAILRRFVKLSMDPSAAQGWSQNDSGRWLYYEKGKPVTGWKRVDGRWYWLDSAGFMQYGGWKSIGGRWYYFYPNGSMAADTVIDGYEIGPDGARRDA